MAKKKKKKIKPIYAGNESSKAGELSTPTEEPNTRLGSIRVSGGGGSVPLSYDQ